MEEDCQKYIKIVYKSEPIGPEKIVLQLTTFDFDKYKKDNELKKQKKIKVFQFDHSMAKDNPPLIKTFIDQEIFNENKKLMEIIEKQQHQIEDLLMQVATPKLTMRKFIDL